MSWPSQTFVKPSGMALFGVVFMGEAPGRHEAEAGIPFAPWAPAGSVVERVISGWHGLGLKREHFQILNTIQCRPPGNELEGESYADEAINHCKVHRDSILGRTRPKVIVAFGNTASRALTGYGDVSVNRGYVFRCEPYACYVIPTFHPSYIARGNKRLLGVVKFDIERALWLAQEKKFQYEQFPGFRPFASYFDLKKFYNTAKANADWPIGYDIENPKVANEEKKIDQLQAQITQFQLSFRFGEALVFPATPQMIELFFKILALPNPKLGHNIRKYDNRVIRAQGGMVNGLVFDTMEQTCKVQSDIGDCYNLQGCASFAGAMKAWKHLSNSNPGVYGCFDVSEPFRIWGYNEKLLRGMGMWDSFWRHTVLFAPVVLQPMVNRGIFQDPQAAGELSEEITQDLAGIKKKMQAVFPEELRAVDRAFKKTPSEEKIKKEGLIQRIVLDPDGTRTLRWVRLKPFATSQKQMFVYFDFKGWKRPRHRKGGRDTSDEKALDELIKKYPKDPLLVLVKKEREVKKIKGSYVDAWKPGPDGRIHATFGMITATAQLTAEDPNIQQIPRE